MRVTIRVVELVGRMPDGRRRFEVVRWLEAPGARSSSLAIVLAVDFDQAREVVARDYRVPADAAWTVASLELEVAFTTGGPPG